MKTSRVNWPSIAFLCNIFTTSKVGRPVDNVWYIICSIALTKELEVDSRLFQKITIFVFYHHRFYHCDVMLYFLVVALQTHEILYRKEVDRKKP